MKLKRVYSNIIPFKGYIALTLYPFVFIRNDKRQKYTPTTNRHELIHAYQQIETTILGAFISLLFYLLGGEWFSLIYLGLYFEIYLLEWLIKLVLCKFDTTKVYRSISFEQEAYANQGKVNYNKERRHYAWAKYVFKLKK